MRIFKLSDSMKKDDDYCILEGDNSVCKNHTIKEFSCGVFAFKKDLEIKEHSDENICIDCTKTLYDFFREGRETKIFSAFNGTGKTTAKIELEKIGLSVVDLDSMLYTWENPLDDEDSRVRNPNFPENMIEEIESLIGEVDYLFISTYDNLRKGLVDRGIHFSIVSPKKEDKDFYLNLYKERGSYKSFIDRIDKNWNSYIESLKEGMNELPYSTHYILEKNEFLLEAIYHTVFE